MTPEDGRYRLLEHTADVRLGLDGATFSDLIAAGSAALCEIVLGEGYGGEGGEPHTVAVKPSDASSSSALVEILNEALFQLADRGLIVREYEGDATGGLLRCVELPDAISPIREVKAVTYDRVVCRRLADGSWRGEITLDL